MGKEVDNDKFTWIIKNFSSLPSSEVYSDEFMVGGCKWRLKAFSKRNKNETEFLSLYLDVSGSESLPYGWRRHALVQFSIVNQLSDDLSLHKATQHWFDSEDSDWGFTIMCLSKLHDIYGGFLVNGELKIVVKVDVLEVIGKLDVPDESEETTINYLTKIDEGDGVESYDSVKESMVNVNGFQVLPSQVETVRHIFERHPDMASEFRPKNQHLRSAYMNVLLSLIETVCQSIQELSKDDLADAYAAFRYLTDSGLDLKWLEEKLEEVSEKKEKEEALETRMQQMEEELEDLTQKCMDLVTNLEKKKADVALARTPFSFDDVV